MGTDVLGRGSIDVDDKHMKEIIDLMKGDKKKVIDRLTGNFGVDFECVEGSDGYITFEMWGHNGIGYASLDKIKEYCIKHNIKVTISVTEYACSDDGGYYYDSEENE